MLNARASLAQGFVRTRREYEAGWHEYVKTLRRVEARYQRQFNVAAIVLRGLEDKTYRGAMIASHLTRGAGAKCQRAHDQRLSRSLVTRSLSDSDSISCHGRSR